MTAYPVHIQRELRKARRAVSHLDDDTQAQLQAAIEHAAGQLDPDLANLEKALGVRIDGGAFALGMQCAAFAFQNTNVMDVIATPAGRVMMTEIMERSRER